MKFFLNTKTIFLGMGSLFICSFWINDAAVKTPSSSFTSTTTVAITFGRGPGCTSRGLCSVDEVGGMATPGSNEVPGLIWKESDGTLKMEITKTDISVQQKELQFVAGSFAVTEVFQLSASLSNQLGASNPINIPVGDYTVHEYSDRYIIEF